MYIECHDAAVPSGRLPAFAMWLTWPLTALCALAVGATSTNAWGSAATGLCLLSSACAFIVHRRWHSAAASSVHAGAAFDRVMELQAESAYAGYAVQAPDVEAPMADLQQHAAAMVRFALSRCSKPEGNCSSGPDQGLAARSAAGPGRIVSLSMMPGVNTNRAIYCFALCCNMFVFC